MDNGKPPVQTIVSYEALPKGATPISPIVLTGQALDGTLEKLSNLAVFFSTAIEVPGGEIHFNKYGPVPQNRNQEFSTVTYHLACRNPNSGTDKCFLWRSLLCFNNVPFHRYGGYVWVFLPDLNGEKTAVNEQITLPLNVLIPAGAIISFYVHLQYFEKTQISFSMNCVGKLRPEIIPSVNSVAITQADAANLMSSAVLPVI